MLLMVDEMRLCAVQATPNQYILRPKAAESGLLAEWYSLHERCRIFLGESC